MIKITAEEFIRRSNIAHKNKYDYSKVIYNHAHDNVIIICPDHGEFLATPNNHSRGRKCPKCRADEGKRNFIYTQSEIIKQCVDIWGDRFDYSNLVYTRKDYKHKIKCNICGEYFSQKLEEHINQRKNGCPNCQNERGWSKSQWIKFCENKPKATPTVYIVRLFNANESFIKIGITSNSVQYRMNKIPYEYEIFKEIKGSPLFVYDKEIELHRQFVKSKYTPLKRFKGEGECYSIDIQKLAQ